MSLYTSINPVTNPASKFVATPSIKLGINVPLRRRITRAISLGLCALAMSSVARADNLTVIIDNVEADQGSVMLQLLASEEQFDGTVPAQMSQMQGAQIGEMRFSFANLPAGVYGVQVIHDRNGNGKLDSNFVGMPTEPWAFSNNASGNFGPPSWQDVKFILKGDASQTIHFNH